MGDGGTDFISTHPITFLALAAVVGVPSLILYAVEVWVIVRAKVSSTVGTYHHHNHGRRFTSAFYSLFVVRAVIAIVYYFNDIVEMRIGRLGILLSVYEAAPQWLVAANYWGDWYCYHAELICTAFLLLNRLMAILMPLSYDRLWNEWLLWLALATTFLLPIPITFNLLTFQYAFDVEPDAIDPVTNTTSGYTFATGPSVHSADDSYRAAVAAIAFCVVCGGLNIAVILVYRGARFRPSQGQTSNGGGRVELRLTIYAFCTFLAQAAMAVLMVILYVGAEYQIPGVFFPAYNLFPLLSVST